MPDVTGVRVTGWMLVTQYNWAAATPAVTSEQTVLKSSEVARCHLPYIRMIMMTMMMMMMMMMTTTTTMMIIIIIILILLLLI